MILQVLKDHGDSTKAWFSARVLSLKDVEALVCYDTLQSDEGQLLVFVFVVLKYIVVMYLTTADGVKSTGT